VKSSSIAFIGLIKKARAIVVGDALMAAIRKQRVYAVLISTAASARTRKQLVDKCTFYQIPVFHVAAETGLFTLEDKTVAALGVTQRSMAVHLIDEEMREEYAKETGSTSQQ
jgi:ribosomal protein L7Ae-like RNA K-turn-binding protein